MVVAKNDSTRRALDSKCNCALSKATRQDFLSDLAPDEEPIGMH